jgi:hypothetical protein
MVPGAQAAAPTLRFAAAWNDAQGSHVGVLERRGKKLAVQSALPVPTRAHGVLSLQGDRLVAIARRPGDWMVRWRPGDGQGQWLWIEPGRAFNGHAVASADGRHLYTTEVDLETGQGLVGVREAASLQKIAEWPTQGADPHELVFDVDGSLLVANGGIVTQPESGRQKVDPDRMDPSLVRLHGQLGHVLGQWRLADKRLSIRHLAWSESATARVLGIALQSEHPEPADRAQAPVLALFDGERLQAIAAPQALAGYGGDIASAADGFAVSCTRAHCIAVFDTEGRWRRHVPLASPCALGHDPRRGQLWAAGAREAVNLASTKGEPLDTGGLRLDNHWLSVERTAHA